MSKQQKNPCSIGLLAHVDAGKTTLSEALLYISGTRRTLGRVDHRDAFLDTHDVERARGITIFSKQAPNWISPWWILRAMWIFPQRQNGLWAFWIAQYW